MFKRRRAFNINDVPSMQLTDGPVAVDIGYLAEEEHTAAFVDIFEKMINDNWDLLKDFDRVEVQAKKPVGPAALSMGEAGAIYKLREGARDIARELYFSFNDEVFLCFIGPVDTKRIRVVFDNPYFALEAKEI